MYKINYHRTAVYSQIYFSYFFGNSVVDGGEEEITHERDRETMSGDIERQYEMRWCIYFKLFYLNLWVDILKTKTKSILSCFQKHFATETNCFFFNFSVTHWCGRTMCLPVIYHCNSETDN
ncbi:hypothetical protein AAMO2058_000219700 [Amorphochlora amoebiformis]